MLLFHFKFHMEDGILGAREVFTSTQLALWQVWTLWLVSASSLVVLGTKGAPVRVQPNKFGVSVFWNFDSSVLYFILLIVSYVVFSYLSLFMFILLAMIPSL